MYDVFISYGREDRRRVKQLADGLVALRGWSLWWDTSVRTGDRFPRQIESAIADSRCVLVVWSHHSVDSDWVCAEASEGWDRGVLVPVRLDDSEPPMPFRQTQTADFSEWRGSQRAPALLALVEDIQRVHAHGVVAGAEELREREARQRAARRRRLLRRLGYAGVVTAVLAGGWLGFERWSTQRTSHVRSVSVAAQAAALREQVLRLNPEEQNRSWHSIFVTNPERLDKLELSILLAIEAQRIAPSTEAQTALRAALTLLPWSDWQMEIDYSNHVGALAFSNDGMLLAAGGGQGDTLVWDFRAGELRARIAHGGTGGEEFWRYQQGQRREYRGSGVLDFSPTESLLATAGPDETARIWSVSDGRELHRLAHDHTVDIVRFSPNGELLASADTNGSVKLWQVSSGQQLVQMQHDDALYRLEFSPTGTLLASTSHDNTARVWRVPMGEPVMRIAEKRPPQGMAFSPDERLLATFGPDVETALWSIPDGALVWRIAASSYPDAGVTFAADGDRFVLAAADGTLAWWSLTHQVLQFSAELGVITRLYASRDHNRFVSMDAADENASAWSMDAGRELKRMPYAGWLSAVAISPDGELMAAAGWAEWGEGAIEVTRIWPSDPIAAACGQLSRNLTHNEWREYFPEREYEPTCPKIEARAADE